MEGVDMTNEEEEVAAAKVRVVVSDRSVRDIGEGAFMACRNSVKDTAPFVKEVGSETYAYTPNLRDVILIPNATVRSGAFKPCLFLEVLTASVSFELDTGDKFHGCWNDDAVGIARFAKWRV